MHGPSIAARNQRGAPSAGLCRRGTFVTTSERKIAHRGLTRGRSWHGPASARRPSRLVKSKPHGVTRRAFARLKCGAPRAALTSARGPWPCSLTTDPLARPRISQPHFSPARPVPIPDDLCRQGRPGTEYTAGSGAAESLGSPTESPRGPRRPICSIRVFVPGSVPRAACVDPTETTWIRLRGIIQS
jgi:hypothetical protein